MRARLQRLVHVRRTPVQAGGPRGKRPPCAAFTLVELLVAIAILVVVSGLTVVLITTVTKAWQRGTALSEDLHHGDFVIEQLVAALRATRYRSPADGLQLTKAGSLGGDSITWTKEGVELVGEETKLANTYHRIRFAVGKDTETGKAGASFAAWGDEYLRPEEFDAEKIPPTILSDRVVGFSCRVATNCDDTGRIEWLDSWDESLPGGDNMSNHVPRFVEVTLRLKPLEDGETPVEMRRLVEIPVVNSRGMR